MPSLLYLALSSLHTHAHTPRHTPSLSSALSLGQPPIPPCPTPALTYSQIHLSGSGGTRPATYSHTPTHEHLHPPSVSSHPYPDPSLSPCGPSTPLPQPPVRLSLGPAAGRHTLNHSPPASALPSRTLARMPCMGFCSEARRAQLPPQQPRVPAAVAGSGHRRAVLLLCTNLQRRAHSTICSGNNSNV